MPQPLVQELLSIYPHRGSPSDDRKNSPGEHFQDADPDQPGDSDGKPLGQAHYSLPFPKRLLLKHGQSHIETGHVFVPQCFISIALQDSLACFLFQSFNIESL